MKKSILYICSILAFFTCCAPNEAFEGGQNTKDVEDFPDTEEVAITELRINVPSITIDEDVKSAVSTEGVFSWVAYDKLGFWPDGADVLYGSPQQCLFYVAESSNGSSQARFEANGWGLLRGKKYYSYYPYDENATSSSISISYKNQNQTANENANHLGSYEYIHASSVINGNNQLVNYNHIGCIARFALRFDGEFSSDKMKDMEISVPSSVIVDAAKYNPSAEVVELTSKELKNSVKLTLNTGNGFTINSNNELVLFMMMSPVSWSGIPVTVTVNSVDGKMFVGEFTPKSDQQAGKGYKYSAVMQYAEKVVNLSKIEPANCYIVSEAGDYMFKAVMGNTNETLNVSSAQVLWESDGTISAPAVGSIIKSSVTIKDGYVYFSTNDTFKKGNALIAAKNSSGAIVWSWHIWCTDVPDDEEYKFDAGFLMDRNLGALSRTGNLSCGLLYQYGRKDPFIGSASISTLTPAKATISFPAPVNGDATHGTVAYATANPTQVIKGTNQLDWVYNNETSDRTWYKANNGKTKYDPCPPGYRVTEGSSTTDTEAGRGFWGKALGYNKVVLSSGTEFSTPAGKMVFNNYSLSMPLNGGGTAYYPTSGCLVDSNGSLAYVGDHLFEWTNYPAGTDGTNWNTQYSGCLDVNLVLGSGHTQRSVYVNWNSGRASGKNVRCQRMRIDSANSSKDNEGFTRTSSSW